MLLYTYVTWAWAGMIFQICTHEPKGMQSLRVNVNILRTVYVTYVKEKTVLLADTQYTIMLIKSAIF